MQYQKYRDITLNELDGMYICDHLVGNHEADIVIIGGGISGLHTAQSLIGSDKKVILIDQGLCGGGMSGRSGGFLTPDSELGIRQIEDKYGKQLGEKIRNFAEEGQKSIVNNIKRYGFNSDLMEQDSMVLAYGQSGKSSISEEHKARLFHNLSSQILNKKETKTYNTGQKYTGSIRYPGCYNINPMKYCQELKKHLAQSGIYIYENTPAQKITKNTIYTNTSTIKFDNLIVAAGKLEANLNSQKSQNTFGVHNFIAISEIMTDEQIAKIMPNEKMMCRDTQLVFTYYRITYDNRLLIGGGTAVSSFMPFDYFNDIVIDQVIKDIKSTFPDLKNIDFPYYRSGRIQATKDLMPIIDIDTNHPNHIYIQGAVGLPRAASCGKFAVDLMNKTHDLDLYNIYKSDRKFPININTNNNFIKSIIFGLSNAYIVMFE